MIRNHEYPADWNQFGKAAGHIRNKQMLDSEPVDLVIAFPGGRGTTNIISQAQAKGIPVAHPETVLMPVVPTS